MRFTSRLLTRRLSSASIRQLSRPVLTITPYAGSRNLATRTRKKPASSIPIPPLSANPLRIESSVVLRDYQEESIVAVLAHVDQGHRRMGISLATGSGKTVIFTQLISRLTHPSSELATQTLILVHRRELVQQAFGHCRRTYPDARIEIEMGDAHASGIADITVASVASLMSGDRIAKFDPKRFKLILIDECHHAVSQRYLQIMDHFGVLNMDQGKMEDKPVVVGVSATMSRFDGLALGKVLDYIVYHKDYVDMINDKWLSPVLFTTVKTSLDLSNVRTSSGDFQLSDLSAAVNTDVFNEVAVRSWLEKAGNRKSTIVFCVDISHVNAIVAKFRQYGIDAQHITSYTHTKDRASRLEAFKRGEFQVLVNCGVFTEGTDIPNIDCVLLARPTRSRNLLVQMIGRGMRLHPDKKDCHVIDMVGTIERGIVTTASLLGLDPDEILDATTPSEASERAKVTEQATGQSASERETGMDPSTTVPATPNVHFTDYDTVFDLLSDTHQDRHVRAFSQIAWVAISHEPAKYVLSTASGDITILEDEFGLFSVMESRKLPPELAGQNKFMKSKPRTIVDKVESLEQAVRGADTYILGRMPRQLVHFKAAWRDKPPTEGQLKMLRNVKGAEGQELTKGKAADMITRMRHGGIARWEKVLKAQRKVEMAKEKLEALRKREEVSVGRLMA